MRLVLGGQFINKVSSRQLLLVLRLAQIRMFIYMLFLDEEASYQVWAVLLQYQSSYELSTKLNLLSKTASLSSHLFHILFWSSLDEFIPCICVVLIVILRAKPFKFMFHVLAVFSSSKKIIQF